MPSQALELVNRYEFLRPFIEAGFIPYIPEFDRGIDFIIYREAEDPSDDVLIKVQLKSRWTVDRKYLGRNIWIAFPIVNGGQKIWHLVPHDKMVRHALDEPRMDKDSASWQAGVYSKPKLASDWAIMYSSFEVRSLLKLITDGNSIAFLTEGSAKREAWSVP